MEIGQLMLFIEQDLTQYVGLIIYGFKNTHCILNWQGLLSYLNDLKADSQQIYLKYFVYFFFE